jgi:hypothetical protein
MQGTPHAVSSNSKLKAAASTSALKLSAEFASVSRIRGHRRADMIVAKVHRLHRPTPIRNSLRRFTPTQVAASRLSA